MNIIGEHLVLFLREGNPKINAAFALRGSAALVLPNHAIHLARNWREVVPILVSVMPNTIGSLDTIADIAVTVRNLENFHNCVH